MLFIYNFSLPLQPFDSIVKLLKIQLESLFFVVMLFILCNDITVLLVLMFGTLMLGTHVKHFSLFFSGKIAPEIKLLKMYESQMWLFTTTLFFIFIFHSRQFNAAMPICGMVMMMISNNLPCLAQYQWR